MHIAQKIGSLIDKFYIRPISKFIPQEVFRYGVCGGANMVLDIVWYFIIYHYIVALRYIDLGVVVISPHVAALIIVFPITFFHGFFKYVFKFSYRHTFHLPESQKHEFLHPFLK